MRADPFVTRFDPPLDAGTDAAQGPLAGLTVAVKDNFDVAGHVTGAGNPEWAAGQAPATATAPLVAMLMAQGARLAGKAQMDELAYSLMGQNARYGTPENPAAPGRTPGGSSSGSAAAVAAGLVDVGLGTDTGGSIRIPASFCGIWGWRPTHGLLPAQGLLPLAPSYDVPGFLTRDGVTMARLAEVFAPLAPVPQRRLAPAELWALADDGVRAALQDRCAGADPAPLLDAALMARALPVFRVAQASEVAEVFGAWITATEPDFGPGIRDRFAMAMALQPDEITAARVERVQITQALQQALGQDGLLLIPTAPGPAPLETTTGEAMETYRNRALSLLCLAGHAGLPQVSIPFRDAQGLPVGLSLVGPRGSDRALIATARAFAEA